MGFVLDVLLVAAVCGFVLYGYSRGFFRAVFSLMSGVCALLCSYAFTPAVSEFLKSKVILPGFAKSITATFASICEAGKDAANEIVYDATLLLESNQFLDTAKQCGADVGEIEALISDKGADAYSLIEAAAYKVCEPVAGALGSAVAFVGIFLLSFIVIRVLVFAVSKVLALPVLKDVDKRLGLVFGVICGVFFAFVFSFGFSILAESLAAIAPGTFDAQIVEKTFLLELLAKYNPIGLLISRIL